jgi:hypothetical protein
MSLGGIILLNAVGDRGDYSALVVDSSPSRISPLGCPEQYDPINHLPADSSRIEIIAGGRDRVVRPEEIQELLLAAKFRGAQVVQREEFAHPFRMPPCNSPKPNERGSGFLSRESRGNRTGSGGRWPIARSGSQCPKFPRDINAADRRRPVSAFGLDGVPIVTATVPRAKPLVRPQDGAGARMVTGTGAPARRRRESAHVKRQQARRPREGAFGKKHQRFPAARGARHDASVFHAACQLEALHEFRSDMPQKQARDKTRGKLALGDETEFSGQHRGKNDAIQITRVVGRDYVRAARQFVEILHA